MSVWDFLGTLAMQRNPPVRVDYASTLPCMYCLVNDSVSYRTLVMPIRCHATEVVQETKSFNLWFRVGRQLRENFTSRPKKMLLASTTRAVGMSSNINLDSFLMTTRLQLSSENSPKSGIADR